MWSSKTTRYYENKLDEIREYADFLYTVDSSDTTRIADKLYEIVGLK